MGLAQSQGHQDQGVNMAKKEESKFPVNSKVKVTAKVLVKDKEGKMKPKNLSAMKGTVKKLCGKDHFYVKTKHGTHYLHESKISK